MKQLTEMKLSELTERRSELQSTRTNIEQREMRVRNDPSKTNRMVAEISVELYTNRMLIENVQRQINIAITSSTVTA